MRARATARTDRFLNARVRTMGIDKEGLDKQIAEKEAAREAERQADLDQAAYDQQIFRILEANEEARKAEKMAGLLQLKADLQEHAALPKNTCDKGGTTIDAENCGTSAAQYFAGEDKGQGERKRLQQAQMRQWTLQQMAEKAARTNEELEDDMRYTQYLNAVNDMREQIQMAEDARVSALEQRVLRTGRLRAKSEERVIVKLKRCSHRRPPLFTHVLWVANMTCVSRSRTTSTP